MALPKTVTRQQRLLTININDEPFVPGSKEGGYSISPLFLDRENGVWVLYGRFDPGTRLPTHFHTGVVHFFTTRGEWHYVEHPEDPQTAGSYLYEPGGSVHTFYVSENAKEPAEGFMVVHGANINFVDDEYRNIMDAGSIEDGLLKLAQLSGMKPPRYIRPRGGAEFSTEEMK